VLYKPSTFDASIIEKNFGNPTNAYLIAPYNLTSPGYEMFDTDLKKFARVSPTEVATCLRPGLQQMSSSERANEMTTPTAPHSSTASRTMTFAASQAVSKSLPR